MKGLALLVLLAGCRQLLGLDPSVLSDGVDAGETCSSTDPCSTGVCKLPDGVCVDCVVNADCSAQTPVCNSANTCERCDEHAGCDSNACDISNGTCAAEIDVAYVVAGGTGSAAMGCLRNQPCGDLTNAIHTNLPFIKFDTTALVDVSTEQTIDHDVVILAEPGARLRRVTTTGPVIRIPSDCSITIQDLEIREGASIAGHGIAVASANVSLVLDRVFLLDNNGRGIDAPMGKKIVMRRCVVSNNDEGGVSLTDVDFEITNSLFVRNGGASTVGGLRIAGGQGALSFFHFNTVADNSATDATQSGVNCDTAFPAANNIVTDNGLDPACGFDFSLFDLVLPSFGTGNLVGEPAFDVIDPVKARAAGFYRITGTSDAIDHADPNATLTDDIDGQTRPIGTADIGADEHTP